MNAPEITIVLGFRRWHVKHLDYCLRSLRVQAVPVIVVDTALDAGQTKELVESSGAQHVWHPMDEWSRSAALNIGARHAKTDWLCFTDADMIFAQNWRGIAEGAVVSTNQHSWNASGAQPTSFAKMFLTPSRDFDVRATSALHSRASQWDDQTMTLLTMPHPQVGQGAGMLVECDWFYEIGGFDETYKVWGCEDNDLVMRAQWYGLGVEWLDSTFVAHQHHDRDWPTQEQRLQVTRNREYLYARMAEVGPIVRNGGPLKGLV